MSRGRRYSGGQKLNVKKVIAVGIAIAVIIMFIIGLNKLLQTNPKTEEKAVAIKYFSVYTNNKWGVIDSKGDIIIEPTYDEAIIIPNNESPVFICTYDVDYEKNTYKTKILNEKNEELFTEYDLVDAIENYDSDNTLWYEQDVLRVQKDGKYGLIDLKGTQLAECKYDSITALKGTSNSLITEISGKKGIMAANGGIIIENEYKNISAISKDYENGYIVQDNNNKYGVVSYDKSLALDTKYDEIKPIYGNGKYYVVKENNKWKVVDTDGKGYLQGKFTEIKSINDDTAVIKNNGKYGVVSISNQKNIITTKYEDIIYATSNQYIAKQNGKYGIIDEKGDTILDFKYNNIVYRDTANFYEATNEDYTSDLIDTDMNVKLSGVIISSINIEDGYMQVRTNDEYKYYNFKFEQKESKDLLKTNTMFLSKQNGKYGFVDKNGVVVVDYIYDDATEQNEFGYVSVKKDGLWGAINSKGEVVIEPSYQLENNILIEFIGKWHLGEDLNLNYYTDK